MADYYFHGYITEKTKELVLKSSSDKSMQLVNVSLLIVCETISQKLFSINPYAVLEGIEEEEANEMIVELTNILQNIESVKIFGHTIPCKTVVAADNKTVKTLIFVVKFLTTKNEEEQVVITLDPNHQYHSSSHSFCIYCHASRKESNFKYYEDFNT